MPRKPRLSRLEMIEAIYRVGDCGVAEIGVMFDCALDNAGFDGYGAALHHLDEVAIAEIYRHLDNIIDANMTGASDAVCDQAERIFRG